MKPTRDRVYIDSSFFIASIVRNHIFHRQAISILETLKGGIACISLLAVDEITHILSRNGLSKATIKKIVVNKIIANDRFELLNHTNNKLEIEKFLKVWQISSLKPRDAMHVFFMKNNNLNSILTFDKNFEKVEKKTKY